MNKDFLAKINNIINEKFSSIYSLKKEIGYTGGGLDEMLKGNRNFSEEVLKKLLPILEISREEFDSWIVVDNYPEKLIEKAIEAHKNRKYKRKSILAQNINAGIKEKGLSQTAFGKIIGHSQSVISCVINGKESLSDNLAEKIAAGFGISAEEVKAWDLADKYSFKTLELALELK